MGNFKMVDVFEERKTEEEKISEEFNTLKSIYEFTHEYNEEPIKCLTIISKEGGSLMIKSQRESFSIVDAMQFANKLIPVSFKK